MTKGPILERYKGFKMKTLGFSLTFSAILFSSAFASLRYAVAGSSAQIRQFDTIYRRFRRWSEVRVWEAVSVTLAGIMADNGHYSIDSTTVRAHISAAGGNGGFIDVLLASRGGEFTSKLHRLADARGRSLAFHLTVGETADCNAHDTLFSLPEQAPRRSLLIRATMRMPFVRVSPAAISNPSFLAEQTVA